ncbi:HAD-IIB family hydrolase [Mariniblastus fucicola]|uniref:HAD-IIB family hydrolase n=1 Tax=Mariniblastus fucicola TaxID=980251 RepID=UPI0012F9E612|nr:HAD-IIB family hydrolase [Mariniblastus fucicola]
MFTDLDGTLIPLEGDRENVEDLQRLKVLLDENQFGVAFVTGRHRESALSALAEFDLPVPQWIISDVGTRVSQFVDNKASCSDDFRGRLRMMTAGWDADRLLEGLSSFPDFKSLTLQEEEKLGEFKVSFYAQAKGVHELADRLRQILSKLDAPFGIVSSVDPFTGDGLIDFLPVGVDKAFACRWLAEHLQLQYDRDLVYAGDSGNDLAALISGCPGIVVGNASDSLKHQVAATKNVFVSSKRATSAIVDALARGYSS